MRQGFDSTMSGGSGSRSRRRRRLGMMSYYGTVVFREQDNAIRLENGVCSQRLAPTCRCIILPGVTVISLDTVRHTSKKHVCVVTAKRTEDECYNIVDT